MKRIFCIDSPDTIFSRLQCSIARTATIFSAKIVLFFLLCTLTTNSFSSCPCFNRYYLYSIFSSEVPHVICSIKSDSYRNTDTRVIVVRSYYLGNGPKPSNYGHAASRSDRCELLIDNQVILTDYDSYSDKNSCDDEIVQTCRALRDVRWPNDQ